MSIRFIAAVLVIGTVVGSALVSASASGQARTREEHIAWVAEGVSACRRSTQR